MDFKTLKICIMNLELIKLEEALFLVPWFTQLYGGQSNLKKNWPV